MTQKRRAEVINVISITTVSVSCVSVVRSAMRMGLLRSLPERILAELRIAVEKLARFPEAFHMAVAPYRRVRLS